MLLPTPAEWHTHTLSPRYPHVGDIWLAYLKQFVARYGGTKLERARDLFESALGDAPPDKVRELHAAVKRSALCFAQDAVGNSGLQLLNRASYP